MKLWVRIALVALVIIAISAAALGAGVAYTLRRDLPTLDGELILPGLRAPVEVYRDNWGVPHIYASHSDDLFMAQGYVHAQDRFYQMELSRRIGQGRLAELFGAEQVSTDTFIRTVGWNRAATRLAAEVDPGSHLALDAYAHGVNVYIGMHTRNELALEFTLLELVGKPVEIDPWKIEHTMGWGVVMAYQLGGNMGSERDRLARIEAWGEAMDADFAPPYPFDAHPTIVAGTAFPSDALHKDFPGRTEDLSPRSDPAKTVSQWDPHNVSLTFAGGVAPEDLGALPGLGSNNWVVSGERSATGAPLLANDTHLGIQMPSIWYEIGLHCRPLGEDCPYDVVGFSFPGAPGVIIGHNRHIAWGVTNLDPDTQDLYVLEIAPDHPNQYLYEGEWLDMNVIRETIRVAGGEPITLEVRMTHFGPVVTDREAIDAGKAPMALRWTTLEGGDLLRAILELDRAANWREFRAALRYWTWPGQNFVYADVEGNIGYQATGRIPVRAEGHTGLLPAPGNTDDCEWQGFIPFDELPSALNPERGYIVTANNAVIGPDYPYPISLEWDYGYRAVRVAALIEATEKHTIESFAAIHGDNQTPLADALIAALGALDFNDATLTDAVAWLGAWDGQADADSPHAALFMSFWARLVADTYADELGDIPDGDSQQVYSISLLLTDPDNPWWDDQKTAEVERRDDILRRAFAEGRATVVEALGENRDAWRWGALHTARFVNWGPGQSGIGIIEGIFNRGPVEVGGSSSAVNAAGWDAGDPFGVTSLPAMRMIVDLSGFANSRSMHTTGQSGHPSSAHYADMIDSWRNVQYHPMHFDDEAVRAAAEAHLTLVVPVAPPGSNN